MKIFFSILLFFSVSMTFAQVPIFQLDSTRQKLLRKVQPDFSDFSRIKSDKYTQNKLIDRSESERTLIQRESTRFSKLLLLENKKGRIFERENAYISVVLFIGTSRKVDSIYFSVTEFKIDTILKKGKSVEISLDNSEVVRINSFLNKCISKYQVLLNLGSPFMVRSYLGPNNFERNNLTSKDMELKLSKMNDTTSKIYLVNYGLKSFPKELYKFKNAKIIDLSKNEISKLTLNTRRFKNLKTLILSDNLLNENSLKIKRNGSLKIINLTNNDFQNFPNQLRKNKNLEELSLAGNFIETLGSKKFKRFENIKTLNLYNNNLTSVLPGIQYLKKMETLDLYHNGLRVLPDEISVLEKLQTLAVSNNDLWDLPANISKLNNLQYLYAHHNKLDLLPDLPKGLKMLDLGYNLIEVIPSQLKYLNELEDLDLSNNRIRNSASELLRIKALQKLYIGNNDFNEDPQKFAELQQIIVDLEKKSVKVK